VVSAPTASMPGNRGQGSAGRRCQARSRGLSAAARCRSAAGSPPRSRGRKQGGLAAEAPPPPGPRSARRCRGGRWPPLAEHPPPAPPAHGPPSGSAPSGHNVGAAQAGSRRAELIRRLAGTQTGCLRQSPPMRFGIRIRSPAPSRWRPDVGGDNRRRRTDHDQVALKVRGRARGGTDARRCQRPSRQLDDPGKAANRATRAPAAAARRISVEACARRQLGVAGLAFNVHDRAGSMPIWLVERVGGAGHRRQTHHQIDQKNGETPAQRRLSRFRKHRHHLPRPASMAPAAAAEVALHQIAQTCAGQPRKESRDASGGGERTPAPCPAPARRWRACQGLTAAPGSDSPVTST